MNIGAPKYLARRLAKKAVSLHDAVCEDCGETDGLHRHHDDYGRAIEVTILCQGCHSARHLDPSRNEILAEAYENYRSGEIKRYELNKICATQGVRFERLNAIWRIVRGG